VKLCEYVFAIGFPLCMPKCYFLRVLFWGWRCVLTPKRHCPAWILVCWCIAFQNWFNSLSTRSIEKNVAYKLRNKEMKKKISGNFGYMGRSIPLHDLNQIRHVGRYGQCSHVCNIWWLSVKGCGFDERGNYSYFCTLPLTLVIALTTLVSGYTWKMWNSDKMQLVNCH